jgi:uncharacterized protein
MRYSVDGMDRAGKLLREARRRAGLTQLALAERAGLAQSVISAYERGHREPSVETLRRLIAAAGFDLELVLRERAVPAGVLPRSEVGERLRRHRSAVLCAAERRGCRNVRVFGSVARGTDDDDSDIDLLVDVVPGTGLLSLIALERELGELLGRKVEVIPAGSLKPGVSTAAEADAVAL